jgi:hypothetical protein
MTGNQDKMKTLKDVVTLLLFTKGGNNTNKTQKAVAMLLIVAAVLFVAGCASQSANPTNTNTEEKKGSTVEEHPDQSKEWIKTTNEDALNVSVAANDLMDASLKGTDTQRITALMISVLFILILKKVGFEHFIYKISSI